MTDGPRPLEARYDDYADWYDANLAPYIEAAGRDLQAQLGQGPGRCLDLAWGTGANLRRLTDCRLFGDRGRPVVGPAASSALGVPMMSSSSRPTQTALPFADAGRAHRYRTGRLGVPAEPDASAGVCF